MALGYAARKSEMSVQVSLEPSRAPHQRRSRLLVGFALGQVHGLVRGQVFELSASFVVLPGHSEQVGGAVAVPSAEMKLPLGQVGYGVQELASVVEL